MFFLIVTKVVFVDDNTVLQAFDTTSFFILIFLPKVVFVDDVTIYFRHEERHVYIILFLS